ncbi:hypothetical protein SAMN05443144_115102 [Fodinibius roseus]|uniref:Uncharacterized protein n=1 Tax=Fodinibius roseus TaxID=1194090 RepID=A0A1M5FPV7_9BACT|nr:hypothetical protein [Fodinibius roseus]SHF93535.1 hypothetical protein SAMN05443144_115102 [Fodinibius roseus]
MKKQEFYSISTSEHIQNHRIIARISHPGNMVLYEVKEKWRQKGTYAMNLEQVILSLTEVATAQFRSPLRLHSTLSYI